MKTYSHISRRHFIRSMAIGASAAPGLCPRLIAAEGRKIPIGLQLYSLREECKKDLAGMLAAVSKIGYKGVEFAGYHNHSAKELRAMLDDHGLIACGSHTPYESVLPDKLEETIEFNKTIGNRFLIVPWMVNKSREQWMEKIKLFNELSEKLKPRSMRIGYHSHAHDFEKVEGQSGWDFFASQTHPEVILQLDTSNCKDGGADPVAELKKYPGRAKSIHVKANGAGPEAVIGEDKLDWPAIFRFCEGPGGTEWYVIEHETSKNPLDAVKRSYEAMKKLGKVQA